LRLLAVDTALGACSVGVLVDGVLAAFASEPMGRGHQERLAPMAADVMAAAGLAFLDLERIAVCVGPGSFTGVRVGAAFAKGLASALAIPCVGVGALEALAAETGATVAAIDARRDQFYLQAFRDGAPATPPVVVHVAELQAWMQTHAPGAVRIVGPGADALAAHVAGAAAETLAAPHPGRVAALGAVADPAAAPSTPLYLRPPEARTIAERQA
jgi:tRNA threonylcarbamoyladenosine biosynthesis protein TsaB